MRLQWAYPCKGVVASYKQKAGRIQVGRRWRALLMCPWVLLGNGCMMELAGGSLAAGHITTGSAGCWSHSHLGFQVLRRHLSG